MDLRISIVNYNTRDLLDACLASIAAYPPDGDWEVAVVDNGSRDGSLEMVRAKHPWVIVMPTGANLGYAGGNNLALRRSRARYDLVLNSDIEVHPGCLQRMVDYLDAQRDVGMCGARLILPDGSIQDSCARGLTLRRYATQQLLLDRAGLTRLLGGEYWLDSSAITAPAELEQLSGACMMCRREAIEQVGLMDEGYWMYCEDTDWCRRFVQAGWKLVYLPRATMLHHLGGSSKTARAEMVAAYQFAATRYFTRHHGAAAGLLARWLGIAGAAARLKLWLGAWLLRRQASDQAQAWLFLRTLGLVLSRRGGKP